MHTNRNSLVWAFLVVALAAAGCASAAPSDGDVVADDEGALATKGIPIGTYTLKSGPTGALGAPFDSQEFPTRLTLRDGNKFDADVLVEVKETVTNPWTPWIPGETVKQDTTLKHGTARFIRFGDADRAAIDLDSIGIFYFTLSGKTLGLSTTLGERTVTLERNDAWKPAATTAIALRCTSAHGPSTAPIDVKLDGDQNASGTAKVARASNLPAGLLWPAAGTYALAQEDTAADGWRRYKGTRASSDDYLELAFKKSELAGSGPLDASGGFGHDLLNDYALSLHCERQ